jgi:hypothetical protein
MPDAAPVTIATRPSNLRIEHLRLSPGRRIPVEIVHA